jgi:hypothetical protein
MVDVNQIVVSYVLFYFIHFHYYCLSFFIMGFLPRYAIEYIVLTRHSGGLTAGIDLRFCVHVSAIYGIREREREREKTVVVFITKQIIKLHLDCYIHKAASIIQTGKKRAKLPWISMVLE